MVNGIGREGYEQCNPAIKNVFADEEKPAEINADGEFDNKTFNRLLSQQNIASRF